MINKKTRWWVCPLDWQNLPDWKNADGPHDSLEDCKKTIALMNRLNCIGNKKRIICEVKFHKGTESTKNLNQDTINTLNSIS